MIRFSPQYHIDDVSSQIPASHRWCFDVLVKELSDLPAV